MSIPSATDIHEFLERQIQFWNSGDKEKMFDAYRKVARNELKVEYIGGPILDGWRALEDMWSRFNGVTTIEIVEILVNGHEGACDLRNCREGPQGPVVSPSIETYHFGDGTLHARYFHNPH